MSWTLVGTAAISAGGWALNKYAGPKGSGGDGGDGGISFDIPDNLLSSEQEGEIVRRLLAYNDTPNAPLGQSSRSALLERLDPNFIPKFFQPDVLNPFLQAQFRLGREQLGRDVNEQEARFQRMGAFFTPDLPDYITRLTERQNLNEQDFLANLGFRGAEMAETLRTDAISQSLGLESVTSSVMDQLLGRQDERMARQLGFLNTAFGQSPQIQETQDSGSGITGLLSGLLSGGLSSSGGGGGLDLSSLLSSLFQSGNGNTGAGNMSGTADASSQLLEMLFNQSATTSLKPAPINSSQVFADSIFGGY